jgi:diadenosine tetraphosphate (Ap4A) HIT family hydrolase
MSDSCLFCDVQTNDRSRIVAENEFGYVIRDGFPVTPLHTLIIPKRHVFDYFGLQTSEVVGLNQLLLAQRESLLIEDPTVDGFNIGMNCGETAGQSVWHCHMHLIPRRKGDVEKPRGGIRHVIAGKGNYEETK